MTTGIAMAQSQRNRSEPWGRGWGGMLKDHTGMMLTLQVQTDSCVWGYSAALFKGDEQGRVPSVRATSTPGCCSGDMAHMQDPSPARSIRWEFVPVSVMRVGGWCKAGRGAAAAKPGCAEVLGDAAPSWAGISGSPPCSRHHLSRVSLAGAAGAGDVTSDALAATLGPGAAGMEVVDPQLWWFGVNPQGSRPWLIYGE